MNVVQRDNPQTLKNQSAARNERDNSLPFNQCLFWSLAKNFERSSCQRNNLAFAFVHFLVVGLNIPIGNSLDELDNIVGF